MKKFRIITIIGARPQFIKAAAVSRAIRKLFPDLLEEKIIHSGQHYDEDMSGIFFEELEIPEPAYNLEVGSGTHAFQTGEIIRKSGQVLLNESPDLVIVYGDTNTTLAGALAASKLGIPVAHIEAGLRSFNKSMPEEINRVLCDHVSTLLFSPTLTGIRNLAREGFSADAMPPFSPDHPAVYHCGDVMYDNALYFAPRSADRSKIIDDLELRDSGFILCTLHRDGNTDSRDRLNAIMKSLDDLSRREKFIFVLPLHPRTAKMLPLIIDDDISQSLSSNPFLKITGPVSYFDMLLLEQKCEMIFTDSGGVQKESFFFRKPCLVLRPESEWKELIELGTASIVDAQPELIKDTYNKYRAHPPRNFPEIFGNGHSAEFITGEIFKFLTTDLVK
jgi:UDP-GlcNAc3NAcA epimerase